MPTGLIIPTYLFKHTIVLMLTGMLWYTVHGIPVCIWEAYTSSTFVMTSISILCSHTVLLQNVDYLYILGLVMD